MTKKNRFMGDFESVKEYFDFNYHDILDLVKEIDSKLNTTKLLICFMSYVFFKHQKYKF